MTRPSINAEAEALIGKSFAVLDHGSIELIDVMGSDATIARAARVSYGRHLDARTAEQDAALIGYLVRERHTSPLEMGVMVFAVKVPIFVARQWMRHRTGSFSEISGRYTSAADADIHEPAEWCGRPAPGASKQGRGAPLGMVSQTACATAYRHVAHGARFIAAGLDENGIAHEQARLCLPLSVYTEYFWKVDLHNLLHFLRLRLAPDAQAEIRAYAEAILPIARAAFPAAVDAWIEHSRDAVSLSATAAEIIRTALISGMSPDLSALPPRERAALAAWLGGAA